MGIIKYKKHDAACFEQHLNLELLNDFLSLIVEVGDDSAPKKYLKLLSEFPWCSRGDANTLYNEHLKYPGEVLERYEKREKRKGDKIKNTRSLALALAYAKKFDLLSDKMFIGNQLTSFLTKLIQLENDLFICGALYLLYCGTNKEKTFINKLQSFEISKTEHLVYLLSILCENRFNDYIPKIASLFGKEKTISIVENTALYAWAINKLCPYAKACRKRELSYFRSLEALATKFVSVNGDVYKKLTENGYSYEEICYGNLLISQFYNFDNAPQKDSLTGEKIAIQFLQSFLSSPSAHSANTYELMQYLLKLHDRLKIKYHGYDSIWDTLKALDLVFLNAQTLAFLYQYAVINFSNGRFNYYSDIFKYNITEPKWDKLVTLLQPDQYKELFELQLINLKKDTSKEDLTSGIERYNALTKQDYLLDFFDNHNDNTIFIFNMLVDYNIFDLNILFLRALAPDCKIKDSILNCIKGYIKGIPTRNSYVFFQTQLKNTSMQDLCKILRNFNFTDGSAIIESHSYRYSLGTDFKLSLRRSFLTIEENRTLFEWLDEAVLRERPEQYAMFIVKTITDDFARSLFSKQELREMFDAVRNIDKEADRQLLKCSNLFLTEEEIKKEEEQRRQKQEEMDQKRRLKRYLELEQELQGLKEISEICRFINHYSERKIRQEIILKHLVGLIEQRPSITLKDKGDLIKMLGDLLSENMITFEDMDRYITCLRNKEVPVVEPNN